MVRKRKRNNASSSVICNARGAVVNLPKIPNVPHVAIPPFLEALRLTTKFFAKKIECTFTIQDWEKRDDDNLTGNKYGWQIPETSTGGGAIHNALMSRIEFATSTASDGTATAELESKERKMTMQKAVKSWMDDVKYFVRRKQDAVKTGTDAPQQDGQQQEMQTKERPSVPYALFLYLWEMQQKHNRVAVRRAALLLSLLLLQKSKDCRQHLELESQMADWVSCIVGEGVLWNNPCRAHKELPYLHREAYAGLSYLLDQGYGSMYPKLGVAVKRLRQQCSNLTREEVSAVTSMPELRKLRDLALRYGQEESRRVQKLVMKSDRCLEILVPRVGVDSSRASLWMPMLDQYTKNRLEENGRPSDNSSDQESDIDWEDGDALIESEQDSNGRHPLHVSAVDRTISAMEASGAGLLQGGELEIDFDRPEDSMQYQTADDPDHIAKARQKLEKYVMQLAVRHLPRLSSWLDGLRNADSLNTQLGSVSLVSLSSESSRLRSVLTQQLTESKQAVSRVLASGSRLNISVSSADATSNAAAARRVKLGLGSENVKFRHSLQRKKQKTKRQSRSTGIQIKCKSR